MKRRFVLGITGASGSAYAVRLLQVLAASGDEVHLCVSASGRTLLDHELGLTVDLEDFQLSSLLPDAQRIASDPKLQGLRAMLGATGDEADPTNAAANPTGDEVNPTIDTENPIGKDAIPNRDEADAPGEAAKSPGPVFYHHWSDFTAPIASGSFLTDGMVICPCSQGTLSAVAHATSANLICRAADVHLKERRKLILTPRETPLSVIQLENMKRCAEAGAVVLPASPGFYHGVRSVRDLIDFVVARICDQLGVDHNLMRRWGEIDKSIESSNESLPTPPRPE